MVLASSALNVADMPAELAAFVEAERRRADIAGAAVVAFDRGGVRAQRYFGYANIARDEPVTARTLFRAASISKLFTTTLVMQEIADGRLSLDDPVNRHLDARTRLRAAKGGPAGDVTIRHLLTHTSGLPVSWRGLEYPNPLMTRVASGLRVPRSLEDVVAGMRTVRPPGERIVYSNGAFSLLGHLVARLNNRLFEELVKERVLDPLGMQSSGFVVEPRVPSLATAYGGAIVGGAGRRPAPFVRIHAGPAGALLTTAPELARFGRMVLLGGELDDRRVFPPDLLDESIRVHVRNHPELDLGYGLGFMPHAFRDRRSTGHDGGFAGVSTCLQVLPDDGVGVVVLTNGGDASFTHRVAERVLESMLGLEPEAVPGSPAGVPDTLVPQWRAFTGRVIGRYRLVDVVPPGIIALVANRIVRARLSHVSAGVLALEGVDREPAFLYPDGDVGRYRIAHPSANGSRVVIDERRDGAHLWVGILHLRRKK
jgi:CubicO group peptidase (beta-lactamase class C family)